MGAGFQIQIINATPFCMKSTGSHSYQMEWNPIGEIAANSYAQFYGELNYSGYTIDDAADAGYTLADLGNLGSLEFNIHVQVGGINNLPSPFPGASDNTGYGVIVQWKSIPNGFFVFPPIDVNNNSSVGWIHDGVVSIGVGYFPENVQEKIPIYPTPNYGSGNFGDDLTALRPSVKHWASNWMELFAPCIQNLSLQELTLPGTHNSGTYPSGGWVQTQYLSIQEQLEQGVRSLDLRLIVKGSGNDRFQLVHGGYTFNLTLMNVLDQINNYLSKNLKEIVILDFHQFESQWSEQDYQDFESIIMDNLGKISIDSSEYLKPLSDIWNDSGRIVIGSREMNGSLQGNVKFWSNSVDQRWCGNSVTTWSSVQNYMQDELNKLDKPKDNLWSLMAQYNSMAEFGTPAYVPKEISNFFSGLNGIKSNIIAVDWWNRLNSGLSGESKIPNFSALINTLPLNIIKGYRKKNNIKLW